MVSQTAFQLSLDFHTSKPIVVVPSVEQVSSDAGLLPFRQLDERIGLTRQFVAALTDRRHVGYIDHSFLEMTRMRVYGILADYADQNDHAFAVRERDRRPFVQPAPRPLARPVHRLVRQAAATVDARHRSV